MGNKQPKESAEDALFRQQKEAQDNTLRDAQAQMEKMQAELDGDFSFPEDDEGSGAAGEGEDDVGDVEITAADMQDPELLKYFKEAGGDLKDVIGPTTKEDMLKLAKKLASSSNPLQQQIAQRINTNELNIVQARGKAQLTAKSNPSASAKFAAQVSAGEKRRHRFIEDSTEASVQEEETACELTPEEMEALGVAPPKKKKPFVIPTDVAEVIQRLDAAMTDAAAQLSDDIVTNEKAVFHHRSAALELQRSKQIDEAKVAAGHMRNGEKIRREQLASAEALLIAIAADQKAAADAAAALETVEEEDEGEEDMELTEADMNDPEMQRMMAELAGKEGIALVDVKVEEEAKATSAPPVKTPTQESKPVQVQPKQTPEPVVEAPVEKKATVSEKAATPTPAPTPAPATPTPVVTPTPTPAPAATPAPTPATPAPVEVKDIKALQGVPELLQDLRTYAKQAQHHGAETLQQNAALCIEKLEAVQSIVVQLRMRAGDLKKQGDAKLEYMRVLKEIQAAEKGVPELVSISQDVLKVAIPEKKESPAKPAEPVEPAKPVAPAAPTPEKTVPKSFVKELRKALILVLRTHDAMNAYSSASLAEVMKRAESTATSVKKADDEATVASLMKVVDTLDQSLTDAQVEAYANPEISTEAIDSTRQLFRKYDPAVTSFWTHQQASLCAKHLTLPVATDEQWVELCDSIGADPEQGIPFAIACYGYLEGSQNAVHDLAICEVSMAMDILLAGIKQKKAAGDIAGAKKGAADYAKLKEQKAAILASPPPPPTQDPEEPEPEPEPTPAPTPDPAVQTLNVPEQAKPADIKPSEEEAARTAKITQLFNLYDTDKTGYWGFAQSTLASKHLGGAKMTREMWQEVVPNPDVGLPMDVVCQGYMTGEDDIDRDLRVCEIMMESHAIQLTALKKKNAGLDFKKELAEIKRLNEVKENFLSTYVPPQPPKPAVSEAITIHVEKLFVTYDSAKTGVWTMQQMNRKLRACEETVLDTTTWETFCETVGGDPDGLTVSHLIMSYSNKHEKVSARDLSLVEAQQRIEEAKLKAIAARDAGDKATALTHLNEMQNLKKLKQSIFTLPLDETEATPPPPQHTPLSSAPADKQKKIQALFSRYDNNSTGFWDAKQAAAAARAIGGEPQTEEAFAEQCKSMNYDPAKGLPLEAVCAEYIEGDEDIDRALAMSSLTIRIGKKHNEAVAFKNAKDMASAKTALREKNDMKKEWDELKSQ